MAKTCAVIPAYNEADHIAEVVTKTKQYVNEVIVIDDGSQDGTAQMAFKAGAAVLVHAKNRGKGAAIRTGLEEAMRRLAEIIVLIDADGQHVPDDIPYLIKPLINSEADLVCGRRMLNRKSMPITRVISNKVSSFLLKLLFEIPVSDTQCGFRALRSDVSKSLIPSENDYLVETEMLVVGQLSGLRIVQIPVKTERSHRSSISSFTLSFRFVCFLVARYLRRMSTLLRAT